MMGVHFAIFYLNADGTADPSTGWDVTLRHLDHLRRPIPRPAPWRCRPLRRNARARGPGKALAALQPKERRDTSPRSPPLLCRGPSGPCFLRSLPLPSIRLGRLLWGEPPFGGQGRPAMIRRFVCAADVQVSSDSYRKKRKRESSETRGCKRKSPSVSCDVVVTHGNRETLRCETGDGRPCGHRLCLQGARDHQSREASPGCAPMTASSSPSCRAAMFLQNEGMLG